MASRCSCRSLGAEALMGASLTCGSEEKPVSRRPSSRMSRPTCLCCPRPQAVRVAKICSCSVEWVQCPGYVRLSVEPLAVTALGRFPRCFSVSGLLPFGAAVWRCRCRQRPNMLLTEHPLHQFMNLSRFPHEESPFEIFVSVCCF